MAKKISTQFREIIETSELGQHELGWIDLPHNTVGRTNLYRELDEDINSRIGISPYCYSSFYLEGQERLKKAQKMLYALDNRLAKKGLVDWSLA